MAGRLGTRLSFYEVYTFLVLGSFLISSTNNLIDDNSSARSFIWIKKVVITASNLLGLLLLDPLSLAPVESGPFKTTLCFQFLTGGFPLGKMNGDFTAKFFSAWAFLFNLFITWQAKNVSLK